MNEKRGFNFHKQYFKTPWSYNTGAVMLAIVAMSLILVTNRIWGVSGAFSMWAGVIFESIGIDADSWEMYGGRLSKFNFWESQASITNLGILFGALIAVLLAGQFKIKKLKSMKNFWAGLLGGLLMGIGARFAVGCNIGAFFMALPSFSLAGWLFLPSMFVGAVLGGLLLKKYFI